MPTSTPDDQYLWVGPISRDWGVASNWEDTTTGDDPALLPPGANDAVTIPAVAGATQVIGGNGVSLSLTNNGTTSLAGQFSTGTLINQATLTIAAGASLAVSGNAYALPGQSGSYVRMFIDAGGGTLDVTGTISHLGTVSAENGGIIEAGALAAGFSATAQTGGSIILASVANNGTLLSVADVNSSIEIGTANDATAGALTIDSSATVVDTLSLIAPTIVNNGTIVAAGSFTIGPGVEGPTTYASHGVVTLTPGSGGVTGDGQIDISNYGVLHIDGSFGTGTGNTINFIGQNALLYISDSSLDANGQLDPNISGFEVWGGNAILYSGAAIDGTSFSGDAGSGTLSLLDGSQTIATLTLLGDYLDDTFLINNTAAFSAIAVESSAPAPAGTTDQDSYTWIGGDYGNWDDVSNWADATTRANPAAVPPGANDAVTIPQDVLANDATRVIAGIGNSLSLENDGTLEVLGQFSTGTLDDNGILLTIDAGASIAVSGNATQFASITVNGGRFTVGGTLSTFLYVGPLSQPLLAEDGGIVQVDELDLSTSWNPYPSTSGIYFTAGPTAATGASITMSSVTLGYSDTFTVQDALSSIEIGTANDAAPGTLTIDAGATLTEPPHDDLTINAPTLVNNGTIVNSGTLGLDQVINNGTIINAGALTLNGLVEGTDGELAFTGANASLLITHSSLGGYLSGFGAGDEIIYGSQIVGPPNVDSTSFSGDAASGTLTLLDSGQTVATLMLLGDYLGATFHVTSSPNDEQTKITVSNLVACYCRGTRILAPAGEVPIEGLKIGDPVMTLSGTARPVRWIGRRVYDGRFIAGNRDALPVCVKAGALADGVPSRDLWVSPGHSLYIDGALARSEHLINGATIVQAARVDAVEYFHIELDSHDVIFADGAPAESYVECDNRSRFANAAEYAALYPDDDRPSWTFCAPCLAWGSPELAAIRAALLMRAAQAGHVCGNDPELRLATDGTVIAFEKLSSRRYRVAVPAGSRDVRLVSLTSVPAAIDAATLDLRPLGVAVERLVLSDAHLRIEVDHSHPLLGEGFHADEATLRWTAGNGLVPEALLRPFPNGCTLEAHLVDTDLRYWTSPPAAAVA